MLINACVILLVISTISFMLLLFFQISTFKKNGGKAISLELTAPPPCLYLFIFFLPKMKNRNQKRKPQTEQPNVT